MRAALRILGLSFVAAMLLLTGSLTVVTAAETLSPVKTKGDTEITYKTPSGNTIRIAISQTKLDAPSFPYKGALLWGGDVGEPPQTVVRSIQIIQNRKAILVPLSAYSDLGDVKFASIEPAKEGFTLRVHGGNTATSYDVTFAFSQGYLRTRTVRNREFPDERWEKTQFSFPR
jgi:hypothetical protein